MTTINETWTHADTAEGAGISADHAWTVLTGNALHISGNAVTAPTGNLNHLAKCDDQLSTDDYRVEIDIATGTSIGSGQVKLMFRVQDASNYYELVGQGSGFYLARWVAGVKTLLTSVVKPSGFGAAPGQRLAVEVKASGMVAFVRLAGAPDYTTILSKTDTSFPTGKTAGFGLYMNGATIFVDNFTAADFPNHVILTVVTPVAYEKPLTGPKKATVRLTASPVPGSDLVIPISASGSTAVAGTHYTALPATVTIPSGQPSVDVDVTPIVQAGVFSPEHTVRVTPSPAGTYVIDPTPFVEVRIRQVEHGKYGGVVGAAPTSVLRFTDSDGKHTVNDPATGPVGYYRVGLVGTRYVLVDPEGWCMLPRGVWGAADAIAADGSSGSVFYNGVKENIGFDPGRNSNLESYYATNEVAPRLTRLGFNFFGGYTPAFAVPWPRNGAAVTAGSPNGIVPTQQKESPDRKPVEWFVSLQKQAMRWGTVKNIAQGITGSRGFQGPAQIADAFDDPSVIPGAPGRFTTACDGTVRGLIRDSNHVATEAQWTTNTTGDPEYPAPYSTPWIIYMDLFERDWWSGQAEYHRHMGYSVFCSVPTMTSYVDPGGVVRTLAGADQTNYSKIAFRNWLQTKYGTIGALNTAWGSAYTTFDSAGGYGVGTGVLDEDGKKSWLGWNGTSADGVNLTGCSQTVRDDLDALMEYFVDQNFRLMCGGGRAAMPNVLLFCPTSDDETPWIFTKVASQYVDLGGSYRDGGGGSTLPVTAQSAALTLSATSGAAVTVTASTAMFRRSHVGRLIQAGGGYGIITRYLAAAGATGSSTVEMEVLSAFASTAIAGGAWFMKGKSVSAWLKYHLPGIAWTTILCEESQWPAAVHDPNLKYLGSQYNSGASYYGFPAGAATQTDRAAIYRQAMFDRFNAQAPDGSYYDLGIDWWQWAGKTSEAIDFGLIALSDDMLDGVEKPQFGDFVTPVAATNDELDYLLLLESSGLTTIPPVITGAYHATDTDVTGTGIPGATVEVFVDGVSAGTTTVAGGGTWSKTVTALSEGDVLTATQTANSIASGPSQAVTVLAAALAAPAITGTYKERDTAVSGTGVPGAVVTLTRDDGTTVLDVGTPTVLGDGTWAVTLDDQLFQGDELVATQTVGAQTSAGSTPVTVGPPVGRIFIQQTEFIPGAYIKGVARVVVPRAEMARYANPNARPLVPDPAISLDALKSGRIVETKMVLSARGIFTQAAAKTALIAEWQRRQDAMDASNTTGADGLRGAGTDYDGSTWG